MPELESGMVVRVIYYMNGRGNRCNNFKEK